MAFARSFVPSLLSSPPQVLSSWKCVNLSLQGCGFHTNVQLRKTIHITGEKDFTKKVVKNKKPVIVQFHADWCQPCKQLSPRMEKSIGSTHGKVDFAKVDIDENPEIAMAYSVGAVPAVIALKNGKVVDKFVGLKEEKDVKAFVDKVAKK